MISSRVTLARLFVAALALASALPARADSERFLRANCDRSSPEVQYDAPVPVDWHALALAHVRSMNVDQPSEVDVARLANNVGEVTGSVEVGFDAPLVPVVTQGSYAFISSAGVERISARALRGEVSFEFDRARRTIVRTTYTGYLVAKTASAASGGFVYWSTGNETPTLVPDVSATLRDGEALRLLTYHDPDRMAALALTGSDVRTKTKAIVSAVGFRVGDARYLFIAWSPDNACDEACCQHDFEIFRVRERLEPVLAHAFGCDL